MVVCSCQWILAKPYICVQCFLKLCNSHPPVSTFLSSSSGSWLVKTSPLVFAAAATAPFPDEQGKS